MSSWFKERLNSTGAPSEAELVEFANYVMDVLEKGETTFDLANRRDVKPLHP